ncbi:hypothetical protein KQX54_014245 [Cotesia glomerata]|uniref:Uncharacterized protein n=1 Tax=Cotesia glomerata TaxID=32391 RepID=A0AAV7IRT0_COTGL|nr:hypothetical protein KQX54_014245 [Cotesia glomerata]
MNIKYLKELNKESFSVVIDFNGYLDSKNEFNIKEYSLYVINKTGEIIDTSFQVLSPELRSDDLDPITYGNYKKYFEKYRIKWHKGTERKNTFKNNLNFCFDKAYKFFVYNQNNKQSLINFLEKQYHLTMIPKIITLRENFDFKITINSKINTNISPCNNHKQPNKRCANDNVEKMVAFVQKYKLYTGFTLNRTHAVIDFSYYKKLDWTVMIKEVTMIEIDHDGVERLHYSKSFKFPPIRLLPEGPKSYKEFERKTGFTWQAGEISLNDCSSRMSSSLNSAVYIYVKDSEKKEALLRVIDKRNRPKVICLDKLGYNITSEFMMIKCPRHHNELNHYCADDHARKMTKWFLENKIYCPRIRKGLIQQHANSNQGIDTSVGNSSIMQQNYRVDVASNQRLDKDIDDMASQLGITFTDNVRASTTYPDSGRHYQQSNSEYFPLINTQNYHSIFGDEQLYLNNAPGKMATDLIINFNGYFMPSNEYKIKELSLFRLERDTVLVEYSVFLISNPPCTWEELDHQTKAGYRKYLEKYGVDWNSGTKSLEDVFNDLWTYVLESEYIYIRNGEQKKLLLNFLNQPEDVTMYEFVCLEDLDYTNSLRMSTHYHHHHQQSGTKNSANDNLFEMTSWLKNSKFYTSSSREKIHMVVDFVGYDLPHGVFAVKEFGAITMDQSGELQQDYYQVVQAPYDLKKLPLTYKLSYDYFYDRHGISWYKGKLPFKTFKETLIEYLKNVKYIYVRNNTQKKLLMQFIGNRKEIIPLDKFGFDIAPQMFTLCPNHNNEKYNCALENCRDMAMWLKKSEMFKPVVLKRNMSLKNVVIDFNGYYESADKFIIKEYSLLIIDNIQKTTITESQVTKPKSRWLFTNFSTKRNYRLHYLPFYSIKWSQGTESIFDARQRIIERLKDAKKIFIRNQRQKELLLNFIGDDANYRFLCCEDLGYTKRIVLPVGTTCLNHKQKLNSNCAIDNVSEMYEWLKKMQSSEKPKKEEIYHKNEHVIVDFIGYYIPVDQFVIKEFSAFVINDIEHAFGNLTNTYFITEKPHWLSKNPMELEDLPFKYQVIFSSFYDTFGISWNAGRYKFRTYPQSLRNYFDKAVNIYVRNNENKRLLLDIIGREFTKKVIVLRKFGYHEQPKMATRCPNHDEGWRNNCAVDNSKSMVRWIAKNRIKLNI